MKTNPMTEEEIMRLNVLPDGKYPATVFSASDRDKNGNPLLTGKGDEKILAVIEVCQQDGSPKKMNLNLTTSFPKILKHFCESTGLDEYYKNNDLTAKIVESAKPFIVKLSSRQYKNNQGEDMIVNNIDDVFPMGNGESGVAKEGFDEDVGF